MTKMLPPEIADRTNRGETDVFGLIRDARNSESYVCLHSVGISRHSRKEYAEADFIVIGPAGIFCIEAKGGQVGRRDGIWTIGWPGSSYTSTEGPFVQAEATRYPLRAYLQEHLKLHRNDYLLGWGVAFPHVTFQISAPEWDQDVVYDARDRVDSFVSYISRLEAYFRRRLSDTGRAQPPSLTKERVAQIVSCLRGDFRIVPTVAGLLADSRRELISLSEAQYKVLDFALNDHNQRIICDGAAGTGKTLIAMEAARRLSREGKRVLLLCFNEQLGRFLSLDGRQNTDRTTISTVYGFMAKIIKQGGFGPQLNSQRASKSELYENIFPQLFESAAVASFEEGSLPQYDVLILDETQDILNTKILNCLDLVLNNGFAAGRWIAFLDTGVQAHLFGRMSEMLLAHLRQQKPAEFALTENFRNPKEVVIEMCALTDLPRPVCRRELPSKVDYRPADDAKDCGRKLRALLVELMRDGVEPGSITVLSGRARESSCVAQYPPDIGQPICFIDDLEGNCPSDMISAASVAAFKGLENEIVILTDLPSIVEMSDWARSIIYVGMSRARTKLYAIVDRSFLNDRTQL